jgi:hypothetical protein
MRPVSAEAAAVSGEHRYTRSSRVPERPGKLRGTVRTETAPLAGACPTPMHPRHPAWLSRAPAATSVASAPLRASVSSDWRDVGLKSNETPSCVWRPLTIRAAIMKSRNPGLPDEPISACVISVPATSRTGLTLPGLEGSAISGSSAERSISSVRS